MAAIFRKLVNKRHWDETTWLKSGEVQADAVSSLRTTQNHLSVFLLDDPDDQLARVVAAQALTRDSLAHFDLVLVPEEVLGQCNIELRQTTGKTPDYTVNAWHRDLVILTSAKLVRLAVALRRHGDKQRYQDKQVETAIATSITAQFVNKGLINDKLSKSLNKRGVI